MQTLFFLSNETFKCLWLEPRVTLQSDSFLVRQVDDGIIAAVYNTSDATVLCINYRRWQCTSVVVFGLRSVEQDRKRNFEQIACIRRFISDASSIFFCLESNMGRINRRQTHTMSPHTSQSRSFIHNQSADVRRSVSIIVARR